MLKSIPAVALVVAAANLLSLATVAKAQTVTFTYSYQGPALPIFRDSANIVTAANLFVPKAMRITKVTANIEIDYPRSGDLNIYMYSPILTRAKLLERNCGSQASLANVTFDDAAPSRFSDVCPASSGTYRGNEPLSNFNDQTSLGTWSLAAENNGSDDFVGYLRGFTVTISGIAITNKPVTTATAIFNAVGFQSNVLAPGEMIDIQGFNMGPSPAVTAPAGDLPTSLGGVKVTFDGTPAGISYASPYLLTVQVPLSLKPGKQVSILIANGNNSSDPVAMDLLNVVPGVYTNSANGQGVLMAVNPDGSMNSVLHPAPKGQSVIVYAAGLGEVTPPLGNGQTPPVNPLSNTVWPVTATVGGYNANVSFAGAAPGYPGLYQVNLQIPTSVGSGPRSFLLFGDGAPSQSGVIIYVQ